MKAVYMVMILLLVSSFNSSADNMGDKIEINPSLVNDILIKIRYDDFDLNGLTDSFVLDLTFNLTYNTEAQIYVQFQDNSTYEWVFDVQFNFQPTSTGPQSVIFEIKGGDLFSTGFAGWTDMTINIDQKNLKGFIENVASGRSVVYIDYQDYERPEIFIDKTSYVFRFIDSDTNLVINDTCECVDTIEVDFILVKNSNEEINMWGNLWSGDSYSNSFIDNGITDLRTKGNKSLTMIFDVYGFYNPNNITLKFEFGFNLVNNPNNMDRPRFVGIEIIKDGRMFEHEILFVKYGGYTLLDKDNNGNTETMQVKYNVNVLKDMRFDMGVGANFWNDKTNENARANAFLQTQSYTPGVYTLEFDLSLYDLYGKTLNNWFEMNWWINVQKDNIGARHYNGWNGSLPIFHGTYDKSPIYVDKIITYPGNRSDTAPFDYLTIELTITSDRNASVNFWGDLFSDGDRRWLLSFWFDLFLEEGTKTYTGYIHGETLQRSQYIGPVEMELRMNLFDDVLQQDIELSFRHNFDYNFNDFNPSGQYTIIYSDEAPLGDTDPNNGSKGPEFNLPAPSFAIILPALFLVPIIIRRKK